MSFGGQTVILGYFSFEIGKVSNVVDTGLSAQFLNDSEIRIPAHVKPERTTTIQRNLGNPLVVDIYCRPWIVEDSKKFFIISSMRIALCTMYVT